MPNSTITLFQTALRKEADLHTMQGLSKICGVPRGNLTSYLTGRARPSVEALRALAKALPAEERAPLILAHLLDECPAEARGDLILEMRPWVMDSACVQESPAADAPDLSLEALFSALRHLAESRPEVREWLTSSLALIQ